MDEPIGCRLLQGAALKLQPPTSDQGMLVAFLGLTVWEVNMRLAWCEHGMPITDILMPSYNVRIY